MGVKGPAPIVINEPEGGWDKLLKQFGWEADPLIPSIWRDEDNEVTQPGITVPETLVRDTPQAPFIETCYRCRKKAPMRNSNVCGDCYARY